MRNLEQRTFYLLFLLFFFTEKILTFQVNCLANNSHEMSGLIFMKIIKYLKVSSAAVVIGAQLRVNSGDNDDWHFTNFSTLFKSY